VVVTGSTICVQVYIKIVDIVAQMAVISKH
jgi:hypothetical protein